jgi:Protein of unknown function (DUF1194)
MYARIFAAAVFAFLVLSTGTVRAQADLALVLAVDVSGSVDDYRFNLQREGIVQGLESQPVLEAVASGVHQTIELAIIEWSEGRSTLLDWTIIRCREDIDGVAQILRTRERPNQVGSMTDVGIGIASAADLFDTAPLAADRKIIDVSGDGTQNTGDLRAERARDLAVARGITINGLPITSGGDEGLEDWYRTHVVGGQGAFIVVANGHESFAEAMRMKLTVEIAGADPALRFAAASGPLLRP